MANPERYTCEQVIDAIKETRGLISVAARRLGCSDSCIHGYAERHPTVRAAIEDARALMCDMAEGKLFGAVQNSEPWAIQFYLKTQGRSRGYGDRIEHSGEVTTRVMFKLPEVGDADDPND